MKHIILAIVLVSLSSCAHPYIREWGNGRVTACCNNAACSQKDTDVLAQKQCGSDARMVGGHLVDAGSQYLGYGVVEKTNHACYDYECLKGPAPASATK